MTFEELGLGESCLRAINELGYTEPTPIQKQAIPYVLQGRDVLGCAQTGTGKTASFTLPMIEILDAGRVRARMPRSLILTPTRELAAQVEDNFKKYGKYHKLSTALLVGGESVNEQTQILNRGVHALIATPGRLIDLFERGAVMLNDIKILVLDECDRMLDMGFIPDIERIIGRLPPLRQTLLFSATLPPEIRRLADAFLTNPKEIVVTPSASAATTVEQSLVRVYDEEKRQVLRSLIEQEDVKNAFIFCNRKRDVATLHRSMVSHGFNAGALHGDMSQRERTETLAKFKNNEITLLVCSDVAARGLDIQGLSHVFNFDVPLSAEDYVHRIGRTGRAGMNGTAITLATPEDGKLVKAVTDLITKDIPLRMVEDFESPELDYSGDRRRRRKAPAKPSKTAKTAKNPKTAKTAVAKTEHKPRPAHVEPQKSDPKRAKERQKKEPETQEIGFGEDDIPAFLQITSGR